MSRMSERHSRSILFPGHRRGRAGADRRTLDRLRGSRRRRRRGGRDRGAGRLRTTSRSSTGTSSSRRTSPGSSSSTPTTPRRCAPKAEAAAARLAEIDPAVPGPRRSSRTSSPATRGSSWPATTSSSTGPTTSRRGCSSRTRPRRSGSPRSTPACVGEEGRVAVSGAGSTPCLRCYLEALPPPGLRADVRHGRASCPTLPPLVASLAMTEALRAAAGEAPARGILSADGVAGRLLARGGSSRTRAPSPRLSRVLRGAVSRARGRGSLRHREAVRPASPSRSLRPAAPGRTSRPWSGGSRPLGARAPLAAAAQRGRGRREPHGVLRRPLRRAGNRRPGPRARSLYDRYVGRLTLRRIRHRASSSRSTGRDVAGLAATPARGGGVAAVPTETFYGLAADPLSAAGVGGSSASKRREEGKPLLVLFGARGQLAPLGVGARARSPSIASSRSGRRR